jgi:hypothetical protein
MNRRITAIACSGMAASFLALAGSASAAYAPKFSVAMDPSTVNKPTAVTTIVTQKSDETPSKKVEVGFPKGFATAVSPQVKTCSDDQASASACPADSRVGTAEARIVVGTLTGNVYVGPFINGQLKLHVFLKGGVLPEQHIIGTVGLQDERFVSVFDNLPKDFTVTYFKLAFDGAPRALNQTPTDCGTYNFDATFTSHKNEVTKASAPVTITGCPDRPPVIAGIDIAPFPPKSARGGTLSFGMDETAQVVVTVVKRGATKVLQTFKLAGKDGKNKITGVGKGLAPGKYRALFQATDPAGHVRKKKYGFKLVK